MTCSGRNLHCSCYQDRAQSLGSLIVSHVFGSHGQDTGVFEAGCGDPCECCAWPWLICPDDTTRCAEDTPSSLSHSYIPHSQGGCKHQVF
jgi:hypothetical protein